MSLHSQSMQLICWTVITTLWFSYNMLHSFLQSLQSKDSNSDTKKQCNFLEVAWSARHKAESLRTRFLPKVSRSLAWPLNWHSFSFPGFVIEHITLQHAGSRVKSQSWIISCALRLYIPKNKDHLHSTYTCYKPCPLCTTDIEIQVAKHHCFLHTFSSKLLRKSLHASWILLTISIRIG